MAEKRCAIVTGGTGALGTVVTESLLEEGFHVAVPYTSNRNIEPFERQIGSLKAQVINDKGAKCNDESFMYGCPFSVCWV